MNNKYIYKPNNIIVRGKRVSMRHNTRPWYNKYIMPDKQNAITYTNNTNYLPYLFIFIFMIIISFIYII